MTKREAYKLGQRLGAQAARYTEVSSSDHCDAGCECGVDGLSQTFECESCLSSAAFSSEQCARDFSPWECYASEINNGRNPEGQWEAYDAGVEAGIKAGVLARLARAATTDSAAGGGR